MVSPVCTFYWSGYILLHLNCLLFWFRWGLFLSYWGCSFPSLFFCNPELLSSRPFFSHLLIPTPPTFRPLIQWLALVGQGKGKGKLQSMSGKERRDRKESLSHFYFSKLHSSTFSAQLLFSTPGAEKCNRERWKKELSCHNFLSSAPYFQLDCKGLCVYCGFLST